MDLEVAKIIAGAIAVGFASVGPGVGIGILGSGYCNSVSRQPELKETLYPQAFVFIAMIELLGLFGFIVFGILYFM